MKTLFRKLAHHSIIPSFYHSILIILAIGILLLPLKSFGAETVKFRHLLSIYSDDKGTGLKGPEGVACSEKSVLVGDTENGRLLRFTFEEKTVKGGAEIKVPQLSYPIRIQMNSKGEIFALDEKQRRIVRLSPEGDFKGYVPAERNRAEEQIAYLARHDALTGLRNRIAFTEHLAKIFEQTSVSRQPFAVLRADLSGFREINDIFGHSV